MDLTKDAILSVQDLDTTAVEVPEWGGTVYVRTMTGAERDYFETAIMKRSNNGQFDISGLRVQIVILTACDAGGSLLFDEADFDSLSQKSSSALNRVCEVAQRINGIMDIDNESVEDAKKN